MPTAFERADLVVAGAEGGFVNNPADPGHATRYGITQATLAAHRGHPVTVDDVRNLSLEEARAIRKAGYWDSVHGDDLPPAVALAAYDAAVNSGTDRAVRWLQQAAGVPQDGIIGPRTLAAVRAADPQALIAEYNARRLVFLADLVTWPTFGLGWARRLAALPFHTMQMQEP